MPERFFVCRCELDLHVENCRSLKEKRRIISSLKEKLKNRYNVSVCEYGDLSLWQRTQLGIVICGNGKVGIDATMKALLDYVTRVPAVSIVDYTVEIL